MKIMEVLKIRREIALIFHQLLLIQIISKVIFWIGRNHWVILMIAARNRSMSLIMMA
jgi:hypothetical protein